MNRYVMSREASWKRERRLSHDDGEDFDLSSGEGVEDDPLVKVPVVGELSAGG